MLGGGNQTWTLAVPVARRGRRCPRLLGITSHLDTLGVEPDVSLQQVRRGEGQGSAPERHL